MPALSILKNFANSLCMRPDSTKSHKLFSTFYYSANTKCIIKCLGGLCFAYVISIYFSACLIIMINRWWIFRVIIIIISSETYYSKHALHSQFFNTFVQIRMIPIFLNMLSLHMWCCPADCIELRFCSG